MLIFIYLSINGKWFVNYEKEKKKDKGENNYCDSNADKLKVNMSMAREALKELREQEQIVPATEFHSKFCCYVKGPKYVAPVEDKKQVENKKQDKKQQPKKK